MIFRDSALTSQETYLRYKEKLLVSNIKGEIETEGVWEQGAEENIWTEERWSDGRLEKTA
jgi:hypothetical protein